MHRYSRDLRPGYPLIYMCVYIYIYTHIYIYTYTYIYIYIYIYVYIYIYIHTYRYVGALLTLIGERLWTMTARTAPGVTARLGGWWERLTGAPLKFAGGYREQSA